MREYPVKITEKALGDMNGIYEYIAFNLQSPENAMGQYNRIADRVLELGFFPEKFRLVDFEPERSQGLRRMLVDNYSVFYVFKEEVFIVVKNLPGRREKNCCLRRQTEFCSRVNRERKDKYCTWRSSAQKN